MLELIGHYPPLGVWPNCTATRINWKSTRRSWELCIAEPRSTTSRWRIQSESRLAALSVRPCHFRLQRALSCTQEVAPLSCPRANLRQLRWPKVWRSESLGRPVQKGPYQVSGTDNRFSNVDNSRWHRVWLREKSVLSSFAHAAAGDRLRNTSRG